MSESMSVATVAASPEHQSSRLEQRIRSLTEQLVRVRSELRSAEDRIAALTTVDPATGLLNPRTFHERAVVEVERASRYERALGLVLLQPDEPESLAALAELWRARCRTADAAGHADGGAIALLLPETALPGALVVAERICAVARLDGVSVSAGCAALPVHGVSIGRLIAAARQALAIARAGGGARVRSLPAVSGP